MLLENEATLNRLVDLLTWYFTRLRDANLARWEEEKGYLRNNFGVAGRIRLLGEVCTFMQTETKQTAAELRFKELTKQIEPYLEPVFKYVAEASDGAFNGRFKVMFGSGGPKVYFFELCRIVRDSFGGFNPSGFEDHIAEVSAEVSAEAEKRWKWINDTVHDHVVSVLEENWGDDFFQAAISNKNIKADCYTKSWRR